MSFTHRLTFVGAMQGGPSLSGTQTESGGTPNLFDTTYPAAAVNQLVTIAIAHANIQSIVILASSACIIKTNSSSSPSNTITLVPGVPLIWSLSDAYFANPITVDITALYINFAISGRLQFMILTNP
jgi:hypothetical protein